MLAWQPVTTSERPTRNRGRTKKLMDESLSKLFTLKLSFGLFLKNGCLGEKHPAVWNQMWINSRLLLWPPFETAPSWDLIVLQNPKPFKIDYPSRLSTLWDYVPVIILVIKDLSIKFPSRKTDQSHYWILVLIIVWILLVLFF